LTNTGLERHVLETYPELEQKVAIEKRAEHSKSCGEAELERRTGEVPKKDQLRARVNAALENAQDRDSLMQALGRENFELYVRGKTLGVTDHETGQNHRLKTLGLELADRVEGLMMEGVLRQYMPKGSDLSGASQTWLNDVAALMNNRPRKTFGWRTPAEAMADEIQAFKSTVALDL
jgi:hypothetical protein